MGFDCTVKYIEGSAVDASGEDLLAFQRAADRLRAWKGLRYVDLLDHLDDIRRRWPRTELWLLVHGDDGYRAVHRVSKGQHEELDERAAAARPFMKRARAAKFRAPPFEKVDAAQRTAELLSELDAPSTPSYRRTRIFEELMREPGEAVDERLVRAVAEEDAHSWVDVAYVCGGRRELLPKLLHELRTRWPSRVDHALFVERALGIVRRLSLTEVGLDEAGLADLPADLRDELQLRPR